MKRFIVVMAADCSKFGMFSGPYGLVETDIPMTSTFLNPGWPVAKLEQKVARAKERTIGIKEGLMDSARDYDLRVMSDSSRRAYDRAVKNFDDYKAQEWVIVELEGKELVRV